jgi:hypothetical protein
MLVISAVYGQVVTSVILQYEIDMGTAYRYNNARVAISSKITDLAATDAARQVKQGRVRRDQTPLSGLLADAGKSATPKTTCANEWRRDRPLVFFGQTGARQIGRVLNTSESLHTVDNVPLATLWRGAGATTLVSGGGRDGQTE